VTSRPETLRAATIGWLGRHFPTLAEVPLLMRGEDDRRHGWEVKAEHLDRMHGERLVVLVDDDPMAALAVGRDDRWLRAPSEWRRVGRVLHCLTGGDVTDGHHD